MWFDKFLKSNKPIALGIDLGTSRSGIAAANAADSGGIEARAIPVGDGSETEGLYRIPSIVVQSTVTGKTLIGGDARKRAGSEFNRTFMSAKSDLDSGDMYYDGIGSIFVKPANVLGVILAELRRRAAPHLGESVRQLPISIAVPASLPYRARKEILDAATRGGWRLQECNLVEEPVAVLLDAIFGPQPVITGESVEDWHGCVYDLGAGTCDVAIFRVSIRTGGPDGPSAKIRTLALGNYERLGGDNFDIEIAREALLPQITGEREVSHEETLLFVKQNRAVAKALKEKLCRQIDVAIRRNGKTPAQVAPMAYPSIEVTGRTRAVRGPDRELPARDVTLTTAGMMAALSPFLSRDIDEGAVEDNRWVGAIFAPLADAFSRCAIDPSSLDRVILSGAACRAPFVPYLIHAFAADLGIPPEKIVCADLDLAVERGAAIHAGLTASAGKTMIDTVLNDSIGICVYGNRTEQIVDAGVTLPWPPSGDREFIDAFFVPQDDLDRVIIELCTSPRQEKRRIIRKTFDIPKGTAAGAPVTVRVRIDSSKVIHLQAVLAANPDSGLTVQGEDIVDCDGKREEKERVIAAREKVRLAMETTGAPTTNDLIDLAYAESECDNEASRRKCIDILDHVLVNQPRSARAWNILGIARWNQNDMPGAERAFRKALEFEPTSDVYRGNLGHALYMSERSADAVCVIRPVLARQPGQPFLAEMYARALDADGQFLEAESARQKTVDALFPDGVVDPHIRRNHISWAIQICKCLGHDDKVAELTDLMETAAPAEDAEATGRCREALLGGPESPAPTSQ